MCDIIIIAYAFSRREIFNNLVKEYLANLIQWNGNLILDLLGMHYRNSFILLCSILSN